MQPNGEVAADLAERQTFKRFQMAGRSTRWYLAVRRALAPLTAVASVVPSGGVVLDLGCGIGYVALLLALADTARRVIGVDWDARRIDTARRVAEGIPNLSFEVSDVSDPIWWRCFPARSIRAVVCLDMLYLLPYDRQRILLAEVDRLLEPNGVLVIKRSGRFPRWKRWWHRSQEYLAVRLLRFTRGKGLWFERADDPLDRFNGWERQTIDLSRGYVYPHELVVLCKPFPQAERSGSSPQVETVPVSLSS